MSFNKNQPCTNKDVLERFVKFEWSPLVIDVNQARLFWDRLAPLIYTVIYRVCIYAALYEMAIKSEV